MSLVWLALVGLIGFLMVSTWRFWSGKEIRLDDRHPFRLVILFAAMIALLVLFSEYVLLSIAIVYLCSGLLARAAYSWQRRRSGPTPRPQEEARTV
jgi:CDP-diacylglycerol--serine O-phosphatidyltransferase